MTSKFWPMGGHPGILHHYTETLVTFEYTSPSSTSTTSKPHSLLFLGGLGDGLATTSYTADIVRRLDSTPWSIFTLALSSSYTQWGTGHLDRDTDEVAQCIHYIQEYKTSKFKFPNSNSKIVIMGHSTGSQAVLHCLHRPNPHVGIPAFDRELQHPTRPIVDGAIMQAPVSDREALQWVMKEGFLGKTSEEIKAVYGQIQAMAEGGDKSFDTIIPLSLTAHFGYGSVPISLRRFMSLMSPGSPEEPSDDDLFSSDLSDGQLLKTFGKVVERGLLRNRLVVLFSGADQSVPDWMDKERLLERWRDAANHGGREKVWDDEYSGVISGASHALSNDDQAGPRQEVVNRVLGYLCRIEKL